MTAIKRMNLSLAILASLGPCIATVVPSTALAQRPHNIGPIPTSAHSTPFEFNPALHPSLKQTNSEATLALNSVDRHRLHQLLAQAQTEGWTQQSDPKLIQSIAEQFLGDRYRAGLLDQGAKETLVLSLQEFDCVLFIEAILGIGKAIIQVDSAAPGLPIATQQNIASTTFIESVEDYRYRGGKLQNYCDRLHYFSDWILDNQQRGNLSAIAHLPVQPLGKAITFMGKNRGSYPQLKSDSQYNCIRKAEQQLNNSLRNGPGQPVTTTPPFGYIPTAQIRSQYPKLQAGDIVAVATSIADLDATHTGLVYRHPNGNLGLIHAAPNVGVTLAADLQTYIERVDFAIGIIVTRPNL